MSFVVSGLPIETFRPLFGLSDEALAERGVIRRRVDSTPGFPCRITLEDAEPGDTVLLLNYEHQPAETPYRSSHAIYVSEQATETRTAVDEIPGVLRVRKFISLRARRSTRCSTSACPSGAGRSAARRLGMRSSPPPYSWGGGTLMLRRDASREHASSGCRRCSRSRRPECRPLRRR